MTTLKCCIRCKQEFPATTQHFTSHRRRKDGLVEQCRSCAKISRKEAALRPRDIIPDGHKRCSQCAQIKSATTEFFAASPRHRYGVACICKECRNVKQRSVYVSRRPVDDIPDGHKRCCQCKVVKPLTKDYFHLQKPRRKKVEWSPYCRECANTQKRARYARRKSGPFIPGDFKMCPKCGENKPCTTEYFTRHVSYLDGLTSVCRACIRMRVRVLHVAHREHILIIRRRYRATHPEIIRAIERNRRAHKKGAQGKHTRADIDRQYRAQKGKCYYCKQRLTKYHVDHVIPLTRGGSNDPSNLVIACPHCNSSKNNKLPHEWPEGGRLL